MPVKPRLERRNLLRREYCTEMENRDAVSEWYH